MSSGLLSGADSLGNVWRIDGRRETTCLLRLQFTGRLLEISNKPFGSLVLTELSVENRVEIYLDNRPLFVGAVAWL